MSEKKPTTKTPRVCLACEGRLTGNRASTSYPDQLIYNSNLRINEGALLSNLPPQSSKITSSVQEKEGRKGETDITLEHFKNQEIFNINQIRKDIERHNNMVTVLIQFFFFFKSSKENGKRKKDYKKKKNNVYTEQSIIIIKADSGVRLICCVYSSFV